MDEEWDRSGKELETQALSGRWGWSRSAESLSQGRPGWEENA